MKAGEMVSFGCMLYQQTIVRLGNEFVSDNCMRYVYVSVSGATPCDRVKTVKKQIPKDKYKLGPFNMGSNRRKKIIMDDERLRAKAKVWLRLNSKHKKGECNMRCDDFLEYLNTDLLAFTGVPHIVPPLDTHTQLHAPN